jgi:hypothetical protein
MKLQASFIPEVFIALLTIVWSMSSWRRFPEIRVLRGKVNIKAPWVAEFPVAIAAAVLGDRVWTASRYRVLPMPAEGTFAVKGYSAGRAAHVDPYSMHILRMGTPAICAKRRHSGVCRLISSW